MMLMQTLASFAVQQAHLGHKSVAVLAEDTDVLVLLIHHGHRPLI